MESEEKNQPQMRVRLTGDPKKVLDGVLGQDKEPSVRELLEEINQLKRKMEEQERFNGLPSHTRFGVPYPGTPMPPIDFGKDDDDDSAEEILLLLKQVDIKLDMLDEKVEKVESKVEKLKAIAEAIVTHFMK